MIEPEKSPKFPQKIPQETLKISRCSSRGGRVVFGEADRGVLTDLPLTMSDLRTTLKK